VSRGAAWRERSGMLLVFALLFVTLSLFVPNFFTQRNMLGLALSVSTVGMLACTMLFCLASGDFDLSVEAVVAFSGVLAAVIANATHSVALGFAAGILAGGAVGLVNGTLIAGAGINALIVTLGTMQIVRGLGFLVSGGSAVSIADERFYALGMNSLMGIPNPVWITLTCLVIFGIVLNTTRFGRHTLAIGGNRVAATLAGVPVHRVKILIFTVQGLVAGFAGVIMASRMTSGQPKSAEGLALDVISACVLGGVSLSGGVATMTGALVGVLIMGTVQNSMNLLNVPAFYQYVVRGSILLAAVGFDQWKRRRV